MDNKALKAKITDLETYLSEIKAKHTASVALTGKHSDRSLILQREYDGLERRIHALVLLSWTK